MKTGFHKQNAQFVTYFCPNRSIVVSLQDRFLLAVRCFLQRKGFG